VTGAGVLALLAGSGAGAGEPPSTAAIGAI
jgi:hypothetical protein